MKRLFYLFTIITLTATMSCSQNTSKKVAEMTFKDGLEHDFGTIPFGGNGTYEFVFKNTGKEPIIITNVQSSCGCTVPTYAKEPVNSKKTGTIKVSYDTNRVGTFTKTITVHSNAKDSPIVLKIKGEVKPKVEEKTGEKTN